MRPSVEAAHDRGDHHHHRRGRGRLENGRVQKFDSDGTFLTTWGTSGTGNGTPVGDRT